MDDIGKALKKALEVHESGVGKLSSGNGNLIGRVEKLRTLGIQSKKGLPASFSQFEKEEDEQDKMELEDVGDMPELDRSA